VLPRGLEPLRTKSTSFRKVEKENSTFRQTGPSTVSARQRNIRIRKYPIYKRASARTDNSSGWTRRASRAPNYR
jgi:hypothetical protein